MSLTQSEGTAQLPLDLLETLRLKPEQITQADGMVNAWITAIKQTNGQRDEKTGELIGSPKTIGIYERTMRVFRKALHANGLDINSKCVEKAYNIDQLAQISLIAQSVAGWSEKKKAVSAATFNQRLAVLSSFYAHAIRQRWLLYNPVASVKRAKVQPYAGVKALDTEDVTDVIKSLDRQTPEGARNYVLLMVLLQTGRRVSEVASLQWQHVTLDRKTKKIRLDFTHCKGGKQMADELTEKESHDLLTWLRSFYGKDLLHLDKDAPLWPALARNPDYYGRAMTIQAISDVCKKYLGTSKVHRTRHTWAVTAEEAGMPVSEIQARLGHESLATTGRYLASLKKAKNKYADAIASMFGFDE